MIYRKHIISPPKKTSKQLFEIMSRAEVIPTLSSPNKEIKNVMWSSSSPQLLTVLKEAGSVKAQTLPFLVRALHSILKLALFVYYKKYINCLLTINNHNRIIFRVLSSK